MTSTTTNNNGKKYDFRGKVALITGSSSGIGAAIAIQFAQFGAQVVLTGTNSAALEKVAAQIRQNTSSQNTEPLIIVGNLLKEGFPAKLIQQTVALFGRLDMLVNNAGTGSPKGTLKDPELLAEFDRLFRLNVRVPVELTQLAVPYLEETKGSVLNISSSTSLRPYFLVYSSSKAALNVVTQCSALELGPRGIRVNAIVPGFVHTPFLQSVGLSKEFGEEFFRRATELSLMGRLGQPEDIAHLASFLVSDDARNITGSLLVSDSGTFIKSPDNRAISIAGKMQQQQQQE